jgi:predicted DsbA family dithiol-disulfide isomerase
LRIDVWGDLVCPWCYLGKRRLEKALEGFEHGEVVEIVPHSFQLDPSFPRGVTRPTRDILSEKYGMTLEQADATETEMEERAAADGLEYHLGAVEMGNTVDAHRVVHLGASRGMSQVVLERLYRAHFTENRSLFTHDSLIELASEAGLDADDVRDVLESDTYEAAVAADGTHARDLGANGVPFFVIDGRYGISGAQPVELFRQALDRAWSDSLSAVPGTAPEVSR